ncbi:MAG: alpha/beta hydrolase [Clostridia bacterium]|nr:alpha/beta hydrolase [Clostridia bacterium]
MSDYKEMHRQYHTAYKNTHWDLCSKAKKDKSIKATIKENKKTFKKQFGIPKYPMMADIFDWAEEDRAEPNSRTPFSAEVRVVKDVVYKTVDGQDLVMDLYFPKEQKHNAPVVMDIPGGGWMIHNRPRRDGYARLYAKMGAVVAVIDHRLCPDVFFPENLHDCIDAYNFLVDNAEKYDINPNDITVTGDSSGGHLSACVGCAASSEEYVKKLGLPSLKTKPANLIFISGAFSFEVMYRIPLTNTLIVRYFSGQKSRKAYRNWEFYKESIPYNYINKDYPECYNNGGMTDILCFGEAKRFAKMLTAAGVKNEYSVGKNLRNSDHCYVLRLPFAPARRDMIKIMKWYCDRQAERGVDLTEGYKAVEEFLTNYKERVKVID